MSTWRYLWGGATCVHMSEGVESNILQEKNKAHDVNGFLTSLIHNVIYCLSWFLPSHPLPYFIWPLYLHRSRVHQIWWAMVIIFLLSLSSILNWRIISPMVSGIGWKHPWSIYQPSQPRSDGKWQEMKPSIMIRQSFFKFKLFF